MYDFILPSHTNSSLLLKVMGKSSIKNQGLGLEQRGRLSSGETAPGGSWICRNKRRNTLKSKRKRQGKDFCAWKQWEKCQVETKDNSRSWEAASLEIGPRETGVFLGKQCSGKCGAGWRLGMWQPRSCREEHTKPPCKNRWVWGTEIELMKSGQNAQLRNSSKILPTQRVVNLRLKKGLSTYSESHIRGKKKFIVKLTMETVSGAGNF